MNFKPLYNRVLVERVVQENKTKSGIIIPDTVKEKPIEGLVIEVGEGVVNQQGKLTPLNIKKGDRIVFGKWGGSEVKIDGKDYLIMKESDILGKYI